MDSPSWRISGCPTCASFHLGELSINAENAIAFAGYVESLQIKVTGPSQLAGTLSGGNQQKVVLAKWLERNAEVIIFDEPTRGIDVGAKYEIYLLMNRLAAQGKAILMISSELPEVLGMSDRILVMHEGAMRGEIADVKQARQQDILNIAIGRTSKRCMKSHLASFLTRFGTLVILAVLCLGFTIATLDQYHPTRPK